MMLILCWYYSKNQSEYILIDMERMSKSVTQKAAEHLSLVDPILQPIIAQAGPCTIKPHTDYYPALVGEIIGQQLSVKAARAIRTRFEASFGGHTPTPQQILSKSLEELRATGISWAKAKYVHDLAQHIEAGELQFDHLDALNNDEVIAELTAVKGIGVWTAHMFLMFCMGRTDVLPVGDLGIRNGIRKLYGFADAPTPEQITSLAATNSWHPYESIASWYVWQSLDNTPTI
jgi:DNA-3-methyladenine glycosylase II